MKRLPFISAIALGLIPGAAALADGLTLSAIPAAPPTNATITVLLRWVFDAGIAIGFAAIMFAMVMAGINYILSAGMPARRATARDWLNGAISGFLIFMLLYLIITAINPALALFRIGKAIEIPKVTANQPAAPGVYFYQSADCTGDGSYVSQVGRAPDFGGDSQKIKSIKIVPDDRNGINFGLLLYELPSFQGYCQNKTSTDCIPVTIAQINSAIIYKQADSPNGDVTFYRNPSFKEDGGYLTLDRGGRSQLQSLSFTGSGSGNCTVPTQQQDCVAWDKNSVCTKRQCPSLAGNISSIKIDGDFIVLLVSTQKVNGKDDISYCQTYPSSVDVNGAGSKQIKWDEINNHGIKPSNVVIIPTQQ